MSDAGPVLRADTIVVAAGRSRRMGGEDKLAARIAGRHVEAAVEGDEEACHALLAELLRLGFPVVEFTQRRADLEELFMNLTKGEVQ